MKYRLLKQDRMRYSGGGRMPRFQIYFRKYQESQGYLKFIYKILYKVFADYSHIEISRDSMIGGGLYIGHAYCITINPDSIIGMNCNIHKGITIGQENRGLRKGTPIIGNNVWIGINATVVGNIHVGDDVLIAPNTYVNQDVPDHSIVFGNPCIIKNRKNATVDYINYCVEL